MIDGDELVQVADQADPAFLDLTEQLTDRLQAGDEIDIHDYVRRYPQWADAILKLLPTMQNLVDFGRAVDRDRRHALQRHHSDLDEPSLTRKTKIEDTGP